MAPDPLATYQEYELRTARTLSAAERVQVTALLGDASALIRSASADLDARIAAGTLDAGLVTGIAVRVVQRFLSNPTGASQVTSGPFSRAYAASNTRGLFLTDEDLAALTPPVVNGARGVGTIRVGLPVGVAREPRPRWPR